MEREEAAVTCRVVIAVMTGDERGYFSATAGFLGFSSRSKHAGSVHIFVFHFRQLTQGKSEDENRINGYDARAGNATD